jgi:hypothetical protein
MANKMFNIFSHRENANQTYIDVPSYPSKNGYYKKKLITAIDKVAGRKRNPYTLLVVM